MAVLILCQLVHGHCCCYYSMTVDIGRMWCAWRRCWTICGIPCVSLSCVECRNWTLPPNGCCSCCCWCCWGALVVQGNGSLLPSQHDNKSSLLSKKFRIGNLNPDMMLLHIILLNIYRLQWVIIDALFYINHLNKYLAIMTETHCRLKSLTYKS